MSNISSIIVVAIVALLAVAKAEECSLSGFLNSIQSGQSIPATCALSNSVQNSLPQSIKSQLDALTSSDVSQELQKVKDVLKNLSNVNSLEELQKKLEEAAPKLTQLIKTIGEELQKALDKQPQDVKDAVQKLKDLLKQLGQKLKEGVKQILDGMQPQTKQSLSQQLVNAFPSLMSFFQNPEVKKFLGIN